MEDETNIVKVAVLEQKVFDLKEIGLKLQEAIERINDVNSNITKMLAVHNERININEQNNQSLYEKVWELSKKIDDNKVDIEKKVDESNKEVSVLKNKFITIISIVLFVGFIINNSTFFGKLLHSPTPQKISLTNACLCAKIV
jgi:hypothetical protein